MFSTRSAPDLRRERNNLPVRSNLMQKAKIVLKGPEAREKLLAGVNFVCDAVKQTLGPFGQNAVSGLKGNVVITNDGKSIAEAIQLEDEIENLGVRTVKEAAIKTGDEVGDGTTTTLVLAQAILREVTPFLKTSTTFKGKRSAIAIKRQIEAEVEEVLQKIDERTEQIKTKEELIASAKVAVEDDKLAELIGSTQWDLGPEGTILAEEVNDVTDSIERTPGMRIDNGFGTSMVMNNLEKQELRVLKTKIILTNHTFNGNKALEPIASILQQMAKMGVSDVVILARGFSHEAIQLCMENHKNNFRLYPINAPYVDQNEVMKDIAAITGGKYINTEERNLETMQLSDIGFAEQVIATRFNGIITGKQGDEYVDLRVRERVEELKQNYTGSQSDFEKKTIEARLSQLQNGFALLKVGANSMVERKYKFDKAEDAVQATKHAFKSGVVKGAGLVFKEISEELPDTYLLKNPLLEPYKQIMDNAGEEFDVPEWVRDSALVVKTALIKAASVASALATAAVAIEWQHEKPKYVQETPKNDD